MAIVGTQACIIGKCFRDDCLIEVEKAIAKVRARRRFDLPPD
jgi:hypothetical protein